MANPADTLQRAYDNYCRIWLMCTELIANPTQQNIDTLLSTAENLGVMRPKPTTSIDGESYDWTGYQSALGEIMANVRRQMVFAAGPFDIRSRAR